MLKIGVLGCTGKMGKELIRCVSNHNNNCLLSAASVRKGSELVGHDVGLVTLGKKINLKITDDLEQVFNIVDVVIDFTSFAVTNFHLELAEKYRKAFVLGTTNLNKKNDEYIKKASIKIPIVHSSNMSVGINVLMSLVEQTSKKLGKEFDVEIFDLHHRNKIDAPSGTALQLGKIAAKSRGLSFDEVSSFSRSNQRKSNEVGFSSARGGDIIGDHSVFFISEKECLTLSHRALSREIFANGAIKAALWVVGRKSGLYSMKDVLGL